MLDLGFYPAIKRITSLLPNNRQTMLFSATMPEEIKTLARKFLSDPVHVQAPQEGVTADKIEQQVTLLDENEKRDHLSNLLRIGDVRQALVFVRTKRRADSLTKFMQVRGFQVDSLHGDMRQSQRQKVLKQFRSGDLRALIATDVAARGIDITNLSHVINFDLSDTPESYIHRVGRTGRAGLGGVALSFCSKTEQAKLAAIISRVGAVLKIFLPDGSIVKNFQPSNSEKALRRKSNFTSQRYRKSGGGKHASALKSRPLDNKGSVVHNRNKKKDQSKKQKNKIKKLKLARNLSQNRSRLSTGPLFPDRPNFGDKTPKSQSRKRTSQNGKTQKVTNGNRKTKIKKIFRSERPRAIEGNSRLKRR